MRGAVIVEDENDNNNNNTQFSTEQQQQQQLSQSPFSQQLQSPQQEQAPPQPQQQSQGTSVTIPSGASSLTDTAFIPNPVQVSVGAIVTWTNTDTQPHTVTAGQNGVPSGEFDSSPHFNPLLVPNDTYQHTFTEAGEYPYFCMLHPNMVGTVIVR